MYIPVQVCRLGRFLHFAPAPAMIAPSCTPGSSPSCIDLLSSYVSPTAFGLDQSLVQIASILSMTVEVTMFYESAPFANVLSPVGFHRLKCFGYPRCRKSFGKKNNGRSKSTNSQVNIKHWSRKLGVFRDCRTCNTIARGAL